MLWLISSNVPTIICWQLPAYLGADVAASLGTFRPNMVRIKSSYVRLTSDSLKCTTTQAGISKCITGYKYWGPARVVLPQQFKCRRHWWAVTLRHFREKAAASGISAVHLKPWLTDHGTVTMKYRRHRDRQEGQLFVVCTIRKQQSPLAQNVSNYASLFGSTYFLTHNHELRVAMPLI